MFTYQVRRRIYRHGPGTTFQFPADCVVNFCLMPEQPFGASANRGRTARLGSRSTILFDGNTGRHWITSDPPLDPLDVTIEYPDRLVELRGRVLCVKQQFASLADLDDFIHTVVVGYPALLNVTFGDPPYVERVDGSVDGTTFRWEVRDWQMRFDVTSQDRHEQFAADAWQRMHLFTVTANRRVLAALHYFHMAVRLARSAATAGEFMAESILNLAKTLEVLFPPDGDGLTREAARRGLRKLGYDDLEIERDFLPAMALRSEIDVAHVTLAVFTRTELTTLYTYTERAEEAFRDMLRKVLESVENGTIQWPQDDLTPRAESRALIRRLASYYEASQDSGSAS
jgi:hypothetical protein